MFTYTETKYITVESLNNLVTLYNNTRTQIYITSIKYLSIHMHSKQNMC